MSPCAQPIIGACDEPKKQNAQARRLRDWAADVRTFAEKMKTAGARTALVELAVVYEARAQQAGAAVATDKAQPAGTATPAATAQPNLLQTGREMIASIAGFARWQPEMQS